MRDSSTEQQRAILAAALQLLATGGAEALRVRDIAEGAGCTTMAVYSRFGGKDGVLDAIYIDGFRRFTKALERESAKAIAGRAVRLGATYRQWARANPGVYQVMFTEAVPGFRPSEEATEVALGSFTVLVEAVETEQREGGLRPGEPFEIAWALWGMAHGLVMLELSGIQPTGAPVAADEVYASSLDAIWRGFAAE